MYVLHARNKLLKFKTKTAPFENNNFSQFLDHFKKQVWLSRNEGIFIFGKVFIDSLVKKKSSENEDSYTIKLNDWNFSGIKDLDVVKEDSIPTHSFTRNQNFLNVTTLTPPGEQEKDNKQLSLP